ncbi:MAG TPA: PQQ-dependent sugar dehydrogenase [Planctomycetota bacterium]|nr:PQQ-dependent sugar dehydrogenase [Planctomycetota bacterium]
MLSRLAAIATMAFVAECLPAQSVPTGFVVDTLVPTGLPTPHDLCFLPDGRCLLAHKAGEVVVHAAAATATVGVVPNVETSYERGLLSLAADPKFASNGHVYVFYTHSGDAFLHVDRFTCTGSLADPNSTNLQFAATSRRVVLGTLVDQSEHHNGGALRFGPDGMLYLACGDDNVACQAQSIASLAGWLLRFEVGRLPPGGSTTLPAFDTLDPGDNPLSGNGDHTQLMLGHGLRNPWRLELDPLTGDVFVGDVGEFAQEEISLYARPAVGALPLCNFGWPWFEGTAPGPGCGTAAPPGLVGPIATVPNGPWASLLVGPRYRNLGGTMAFGTGYEGQLFFADYFAGDIRRLSFNGVWGPAPAVPGQPTATEWATGFSGITSLRQGPDGALYCTRHPGMLQRVRPLGANNGITAVSGSGQRVAAGESFPLPLRARVVGPTGSPLANAAVTFTVTGPGVLTSGNPALTDAQGFASVTLAAPASAQGAITVTATTAGAPTSAPFGVFARRLTASAPPSLLVLTMTNETDAVPPVVPYFVLMSFPGSPPLPTPWGTLCVHPLYPLALVLEDAFGLFGGVSFSGTGGLGNPGFTLVYPLPPGLLAGQLMSFQAVGFDLLTGLFVSNCEQVQF